MGVVSGRPGTLIGIRGVAHDDYAAAHARSLVQTGGVA
jgi:hypothetical protein